MELQMIHSIYINNMFYLNKPFYGTVLPLNSSCFVVSVYIMPDEFIQTKSHKMPYFYMMLL